MGKLVVYLVEFSACVLWESRLLIAAVCYGKVGCLFD